LLIVVRAYQIDFVFDRTAPRAPSFPIFAIDGGWPPKIASPHRRNGCPQITCNFDRYISIISRKIMSQAGSTPKPPARKDRDLLEEVVGLSRTMADQQSRAMDRLIKLLEASIPNQAMVNALLKPPIPTGVAYTSDPLLSTGLHVTDFLRQPNAPPSAGTASDQVTSTIKSE
jgi:hypothetical protein